MSFSYEQKKEIIEYVYKSSCCRRCLLSGILFAKGTCVGRNVSISFEKAEFAEYSAKLVKEFYGQEGSLTRPDTGGRTIVLSFDSPSAAKYIAEIDNLSNFTVCDLIKQRCSNCLPSFLRGVFLASGRVSDPQKQFSLEFSLNKRSDAFIKILNDLSMKPSLSHKKNADVVYFHREDEIESFYGYAGLNRAVFDIIETKIKSLARRESQRYLHCVTSNFDRMTAVSERQINIISKLDELRLLSSLPEELAETARLRLRYPDLPLSALAAQMTPAISKSGLSHRLKKIETVGAKLLKLDDSE